MIRKILAAALAVATLQFTCTAKAQPYPSKQLRIVVPFPPGGAADISGRVLAELMGKSLGQSVVVENRPGGSTIIGSEVVARAPADGYTMLVVFPSFIVNPSMRSTMPFDPLKDFKAVGQVLAVPMAIGAAMTVPAKNLQELITLARMKPGELSYGTPGLGTTHHVMGEMLKQAAKINIVHAPFQGGTQSLTAVSGGHIQLVYGNAAEIAPAAKGGKVRPIVVTSAERVDLLPDTPTMRESGFPELEAVNWAGLVVAAATPPAAIARLNADLVAALRNPELHAKFKSYGMIPTPSTPEQFGAFLQSESARYAKAVKEAGVKAE
ncbi:MAG: tripartite tricarboxylate transporter substrate binding protein [Betaproteobacteria bacterium]|nr:tripartite tricarboxylate transporter substrate binding protein [Betaproteobacteria bacterium]